MFTFDTRELHGVWEQGQLPLLIGPPTLAVACLTNQMGGTMLETEVSGERERGAAASEPK